MDENITGIKANCIPDTPDIDPIYPGAFDETTSLDVVTRYKKLMTATLGEDSFYERSKKSIEELSVSLELTKTEKASLIAEQITQMTVGISGNVLSTAFQWAERDAKIGYETALINAQAEAAAMGAIKAAHEVCLVDSQNENACVDKEVKLASSLRENGTVATYDSNDVCRPTKLRDEGLRWKQMENYDANIYQTLADAFRKSGNVIVGRDGNDGVNKGYAGDEQGYTTAQTNVAYRQIVSFEDSKRNHAVNASSQTIGQLIASEAILDPQIVDNYNRGMHYLLTNSAPIMPGGPSDLTGVTFDFSTGDTDTIACDGSTPPICEMTTQVSAGFITMRGVIDPTGNTRVGDKVVCASNSGEYITYKDLTDDDIINGYVLLVIPTVTYDAAGGATEQYSLDLYVQDYYGNKSVKSEITINIKYNV